MQLSAITPEWIAEMRDALHLKDVDIYTAIDLDQAKFSKSMTHKRRFQPAEIDAIVAFFSGPQAAAKVQIARYGNMR